MSITQVKTFLGWCTVINIMLLLLSTTLTILLRRFIHQFHGKLFSLTPAAINNTIYAFLGAYKLLILVFNLVPYIALLLVADGA